MSIQVKILFKNKVNKDDEYFYGSKKNVLTYLNLIKMITEQRGVKVMWQFY